MCAQSLYPGAASCRNIETGHIRQIRAGVYYTARIEEDVLFCPHFHGQYKVINEFPYHLATCSYCIVSRETLLRNAIHTSKLANVGLSKHAKHAFGDHISEHSHGCKRLVGDIVLFLHIIAILRFSDEQLSRLEI